MMEKEVISIEQKTAGKIAAARRYREYTQRLLASKLNVDQGEVSILESGRRNVQIQTLQRIADALDMDLWIEFVPKECAINDTVEQD